MHWAEESGTKCQARSLGSGQLPGKRNDPKSTEKLKPIIYVGSMFVLLQADHISFSDRYLLPNFCLHIQRLKFCKVTT